MKKHDTLKKGMALLLSMVMMFGMYPVFPEQMTIVQAAEGIAEENSILSCRILLHDKDADGEMSKGDIVDIGSESFYITGINDTDITCFAVKGISVSENKQSDNPDYVRYGDSAYVTYGNSEVKPYAVAYGEMLHEKYGLELKAEASLVNYKDIGYVAPYNYSANIYAEKTWYQNGNYWTSNTYREYGAWKVSGNMLQAVPGNTNTAMVRPSITFEKSKVQVIKEITNVEIDGIDMPVAGQALDTDAVSGTSGINVLNMTWTSDHEISEIEKQYAEYDTSYTAQVTLEAENGYVFSEDVRIRINGEDGVNCTVQNEGKACVVTATPYRTEKIKLIRVTTPEAITVSNGIAYADMNLPAKVEIVLEKGVVTQAAVSWDTTTPESGSYDPTIKTKQQVTLTGIVICPENIDPNSISLLTSITVTISAANGSTGGSGSGSGSIGGSGSTSGNGSTSGGSSSGSGNVTIVPTPEPTPEPTPKPTPVIKPVKSLIPQQATATVTKTGQAKLTWKAVEGAEGYHIYRKVKGSKKDYQLVGTAETTNIVQKKLNSGKTYQYYVTAYKTIDGKETQIGKSAVLYVTADATKYTDVKSVKISKTAYRLSIGKKKKLVVSLVKKNKTKALTSEAKKIRYYTTDSKVAKVNSKGIVTTRGKGKCYIYVVTGNGTQKRIKIVVGESK